MIRIRFFGPREFNQNGFRAAQYVLQQCQSGSLARVRSKALISCVTAALVSRQKCDGQVKDAIDKMPSHLPASPGPIPSKITRARCANWQASSAGQTRSQHTAQRGRHWPPDEHECNNAGQLAGIGRKTNSRATGRRVAGIRQGDANGSGVNGRRSDSRKTPCKRSTLEAFSSWKLAL